MFLNLKKFNSRYSHITFKIFCLSAGFFLISTFAGVLTSQAACVVGDRCPEGQVHDFAGSCPEGQVPCVLRSELEGGGTGEKTTPAPDYGLGEATEGTGLANTPISVRVSTLIGAIVGFVGVIFLVLMIYGGLTWMTAGGNEEKIGKAKKIIVNSTIGIIIVMLSYAITYYIIQTVAGS